MTRHYRRRPKLEDDHEYLAQVKELQEKGFSANEITIATGTYLEKVKKAYELLEIPWVRGKPGRKKDREALTVSLVLAKISHDCRIYDEQSCPVFCVEECANKKE